MPSRRLASPRVASRRRTHVHTPACAVDPFRSLTNALERSRAPSPHHQADVDNEFLHIPQHNANYLTFGLYLRSVYFAMVGMSTVGYGDIVPTNHLEMM